MTTDAISNVTGHKKLQFLLRLESMNLTIRHYDPL